MDEKVSTTLFRYGALLTLMSILARMCESMWERETVRTAEQYKDQREDEDPDIIDADFTHVD